ncbi:uncharacterized protein LOC112569182 [Pomacea canaliculata]|uniref:uncharacterized protein LOC112569182 n=1 Tax=Pomacea canaliculata TaxID=400727 RepID=UPI000D73F8D9|nr:uncharacterized protein LOC112569182 [Pomacea canaliculata]XP_025102694.1 uncharacterized protein LOC112569182 [Pomacea canaliculata]XP_025102695.1 uncharacterized protein LOC112569182 [Pomacea canaliculata]
MWTAKKLRFARFFPGYHPFLSASVAGYAFEAPDASGFHLEYPKTDPTREKPKWTSLIKDISLLMSPSIAAELQEENSWKSNPFAKSFEAGCLLDARSVKLCLGVLFLWLMPLANCSTHGKQTNCELQKEELAHWKLTCPFHEDIKTSKKDFEVYHMRQQGLLGLVAEGKWFDDEPSVYTKRGYEFVSLIGDKVAIKITRAHHGEMFFCGFSPLLLSNAVTCHVPKREETNSTTAANKDFQSFKQGQKAEMSPTALVDTDQPLRNNGGNSKNPPAWILLMLAAFIFQSSFLKA